ncbi:MAG: hypothetical protein ABR986_09225 [Methanomassiliicoccales archaeon]
MVVVKKVKGEFLSALRAEGVIPSKGIERLEQLMSNIDTFSEVEFDKLLNEMVKDES